MEEINLKTRRRSVWYILLFSLALFILFSAAMYRSVAPQFLWARVQGKIVGSSVLRDCDMFGRRGSRGTLNCHNKFDPTIMYTYNIDGKDYNGTYNPMGQHSFDTKAKTEEWIKDKKAGLNVEVIYNPDDPSDSIIYPEFNFFVTLGFVFSGLILLISGRVLFLKPKAQ